MESQTKYVSETGERIKGGHTKNGYMAMGLVSLFAAFILGMIIYVYHKKDETESLDNRMRWPLGGLRDDTGSHNPLSVFGRGYGLDQTRTGASVMQDGFGLQLGQASFTTGGKTQSEYGPSLGDKAGFSNPYQVMALRPTKPSLKESLDKKEKLEPKTTDEYLQSRLY